MIFFPCDFSLLCDRVDPLDSRLLSIGVYEFRSVATRHRSDVVGIWVRLMRKVEFAKVEGQHRQMTVNEGQ